MRILSIHLTLLATASLTISSACRPPSGPVLLTSFYVVAGNTGNPSIDGTQLAVDHNLFPVYFNAPGYNVAPLSLEHGTNFLMEDGLYIVYDSISASLFSVSGADISPYGYEPLVCAPVAQRIPRTCAPAESPWILGFYTYQGASEYAPVFMYDTSGNVPAGLVRLEFIPQVV